MANRFLQMLFGRGGTEPSYGGLRVPRQRVEDDAMLIRQGNPQERFRQYHSPASDVLGLPPLSDEQKAEIQGGFMEAPNTRKENQAKRDSQLKGAVTGVGSILSQAFADAQQPQSPLQFDKLNMGQLIPLIDPRFRRAKGGKVKKGQPYLVGEEGAEIVVPEQDGEIIANDALVASAPPPPDKYQPVDTTEVDELGRQLGGQRQLPIAPPQEEVSVTEEVTEPSVADMWRQKIQAVQGRDYSKKKNEDGTTTYGKDFDHKRNWKDALRGAGLGVLQSLANYQANPNDPNPLSSMLGRAIGGAGAGGVLGATVDNADNKMFDRLKLAQMMPQYEQAYGMERQKKADDDQSRVRDAQIKNYEEDNANARWGRRIQEDNIKRQRENTESKERTSRMNAVAGLVKQLPEFIPGDPRFKEIEEAMGDVKLPLFTKDAKKKVDLKQDQRTGAWTVILTNPITGEQEVRDVKKDGKTLTTTPTVVMQGELGIFRQNDAQEFTAQENAKNREHDLKKQQIAASLQKEIADYNARIKESQTATDAALRASAAQQAEESRKRILEYQKQLTQP